MDGFFLINYECIKKHDDVRANQKGIVTHKNIYNFRSLYDDYFTESLLLMDVVDGGDLLNPKIAFCETNAQL